MRVLTEIGEQGLTLPDGRSVVLRPSFYAMTRLGDPARIVEVFAEIHQPPVLVEHMDFDLDSVKLAGDAISVTRLHRYWRSMLFLSWEIICACAEEDVTAFIGEPGSRYGSYRLGQVSPEIMLALARSLMQHGTIGPIAKAVEHAEKAPANAVYVREFEALKFVSKAVAHLGVTEGEAWNMTMSSFAAHWEAKFGEQKEARYADEHTRTMDWLARVNAKRQPKPKPGSRKHG